MKQFDKNPAGSSRVLHHSPPHKSLHWQSVLYFLLFPIPTARLLQHQQLNLSLYLIKRHAMTKYGGSEI
jgi:hypothetical protein